MAIANLGARGPLLHRLPGRRDHRRRRTARPASSTSRPAASGSARRGPRSSSSPASRASPRTPRRSPRSAAAAPTPRRSRSPRRSRPTSARSTPTSTASSPPTRASCPRARRVDRISYEEMLEMAASGAKVLHAALRRVRPTLRRADPRAFLVLAAARAPGSPAQRSRRTPWKQAIISGVAHDRSEAKVTVVGVPDKPGEAAAIFQRDRRRRAQHRHDRAERLGRRHGHDRHLVHAAQGRRPDARSRRCERRKAERRLRAAAVRRPRSARCRSSAPACEVAPRRVGDGSSRRSPTPASTSR